MLESLATIYNSLLRVTNRPTREKYKLNVQIPKSNQVRFTTKNLT